MTFNMKTVQKYGANMKAQKAITDLGMVMGGAPRVDAAQPDFMAAMGAVVPSLMEQMKRRERDGQTGPLGQDPLNVAPLWNMSREVSGPGADTDIFSPANAALTVHIGQLGVQVARRTAQLMGRSAITRMATGMQSRLGAAAVEGQDRYKDRQLSPREDAERRVLTDWVYGDSGEQRLGDRPLWEGGATFQEAVEQGMTMTQLTGIWRQQAGKETLPSWGTPWGDATVADFFAEGDFRGLGVRLEDVRGLVSASQGLDYDSETGAVTVDPTRSNRDVWQNPDGSFSIRRLNGEVQQLYMDVTSPEYLKSQGVEDDAGADGVMQVPGGAPETPEIQDEVLASLLQMEEARLSQGAKQAPDALRGMFIDLWGDGESNPHMRMIEQRLRITDAPSPLDGDFMDVVDQTVELERFNMERGTMTAWDFIEKVDELAGDELIQFQHALWRAGYYGNSFDVYKDEEPPWGERGTAYWNGVGWLVENLTQDNSWSVERWLAERAAFVDEQIAQSGRGGGGRGGGGGGGGRVVVRLSDPEAIRDAGNRFAKEEIGYELTGEDHAELVEYVHGLERELAATLQAGGEVTEVDVAARIRAWIAKRYPEARQANRMNDAWSAIRSFIMGGQG